MRSLKSLLAVALLAGAAALVGVVGWRFFEMPFDGVELPDTLTAAETQAVRRVVERWREGASASVAQLARALEETDWIRAANVRHIWPRAIRIDLELHALTPSGLTDALASDDQVRRVYEMLSPWLADAGLSLAALDETDLGEWSLTLGNGVPILLGDDDLGGRLGRALAVYRNELEGRMDQVERIDARYAGGVAVRWRGGSSAPPRGPAPASGDAVMLARH